MAVSESGLAFGEALMGCDVPILARIRNLSTGGYAIAADLSSVNYSIYDIKSAPAVLLNGPTALTIAQVWYDSLQGANFADFRWKTDTVGYNFLWIAPPSAFYVAGAPAAQDFRVQLRIVQNDGRTIGARGNLRIRATDQPW
jgi:hypothetical protein